MKIFDAIKHKIRQPKGRDITEVIRIEGHQPPKEAASLMIARMVAAHDPAQYRARVTNGARYITGPHAIYDDEQGERHHYIYNELELAIYEINPLTAKKAI